MVYGNGIPKFERKVASDIIIYNLIDTFVEAWYVWYDEYGQDAQDTDRKVRNTVKKLARLLLTVLNCPAFLDISPCHVQ